MKILAVDDDVLIHGVLRSVLGGAGYDDVTFAASATEARVLVSSTSVPFDAYLLDIQMPGDDGIALCRWLRKEAGCRAEPIIMITAMSAKIFLDSAFQAGATDYVTKPFDVTELGTRIRQADRQSQANRRIRDDAIRLRALKAALEDMRRVDLNASVALDDVEGALEPLALENYLLRLGRGDLAGTSLIAFRLPGIARLHARLDATGYRDLLADAAESLLAALQGSGALLAHAGAGAFVTVLPRGFEADLDEVAGLASQLLDDLGLIDDEGFPIAAPFVVAGAHHCGMMTSGRDAVGVLHALSSRARVDSLETAEPVPQVRARQRFGLVSPFARR